jgi:uncharacterized protein (TIGR00299 family) protein
MKIAYFDCFSGISGDMIIGALLDAGLDFETFKSEIAKLKLTEYDISLQKITKQNLAASKFEIVDMGNKVYRHLKNLDEIVDSSELEPDIKRQTKNIFLRIAQAEAKVHNRPLEKVHFHEIGAIDTIIDVVGALIGLNLLSIKKIYCSKINVGSGFVEFSHGKFPVPAPATAEILNDIPIYSTNSKGELVTPTGAAIISEICQDFGDMPEMKLETVGYGAGTKEYEHPNVLRIFIGECLPEGVLEKDTVSIIETNIDDMNPQIFDYVFERLLEEDALDVFITNIAMKKNRQAVKLTVICEKKDEQKLSEIILRETKSIGVRIRKENRKKLTRKISKITSKYGKIKIKISSMGGEVITSTPEYKDCKRIAREKGIPLRIIMDEAIGVINREFHK